MAMWHAIVFKQECQSNFVHGACGDTGAIISGNNIGKHLLCEVNNFWKQALSFALQKLYMRNIWSIYTSGLCVYMMFHAQPTKMPSLEIVENVSHQNFFPTKTV